MYGVVPPEAVTVAVPSVVPQLVGSVPVAETLGAPGSVIVTVILFLFLSVAWDLLLSFQPFN